MIIVDVEVRKRRLHNFARQGTIQKEERRDSKDSFKTEIVVKDLPNCKCCTKNRTYEI